MSWSTRKVAELAGTSLRAVRHYHEVGLLAEPERHANGYKQYGVAHLIRLLHIKRLTGLGFSLSQIADMGDADDPPEEALRSLDAELADSIERLQRARLELSLILDRSAPTDLTAGYVPAAADPDLTRVDRSHAVVMSHGLGPRSGRTWAYMLRESPPDLAGAEFDHFHAEAGGAARHDGEHQGAGRRR